MAVKQYKFVAEKGVVTMTADLNIRLGVPATKDATKKDVPVARLAKAGSQVVYIGYVLDGEAVGGVTKWFMTPEGDFFWSGNVTPVKPATDGSVASGKILGKPLDRLICTQEFGMRPEFYKKFGQ